MFKEFKEFAMKGSVLDLAVGVVIGAAFGKITSSFVTDVLMPPLSLLLGRVNFSNLFITLSGETFATLEEAKKAGAVTLNYGAVPRDRDRLPVHRVRGLHPGQAGEPHAPSGARTRGDDEGLSVLHVGDPAQGGALPAVHVGSQAGGPGLKNSRFFAVGKLLAGPVFGSGLLAAACVLAFAVPASAQKDSVLVLGGSFSAYRPSSDNVENTWGIGLVARLRRDSGFGATIGLNWFRGDVNGDIGGARTRLATVLVRPLMVGVGYTRRYAHFSLGGSLVAGYSFNGLRATGAASDALAALGQPGATFDITDTFVWRPSFAVWWELGNRFGLMTSVSYVSLRPEIVTTTTAGTTRRRVDMSAPVFSVGLGYGIF